MNSTSRNTGSFAVKKGETVFCEGQKVQALNLLLQGKLNIFISPPDEKSFGEDILKKSFRIFDVDQNIFLGANDIFLDGPHGLSCRAGSDCGMFVYDVKTPEEAADLISSQRDYGAYILNSLCLLIDKTRNAYQKLLALKNSLKGISDNLITFFWALKEKYGFEYIPAPGYFPDGRERLAVLRQEGSVVPLVFSQQFIERDFEDGNAEMAEDDERIDYYSRIYALPSELRKSFFGADARITRYHASDASRCLDGLLRLVRDVLREADEYCRRLYNEDGDSICSSYLRAAGEIGASGYDNTPALNAVEYIISRLKYLIALYETEYMHQSRTDLAYLECWYNNVRAGLYHPSPGGGAAGVKAGAGYESLPEELKDSAKKIMTFAGLSEERSDMFLMNLAAFRNLRDRLSTDETARSIRSDVSSLYFEVYEAVLKNAISGGNTSRLVNMFLNFGYMDEKLLSPEQALALYKLAGRANPAPAESVHTMREWLSLVYGMKRDPSINEFGQDYFDVFREMKKYGQASDKDRLVYESNSDARLSHEIMNMFKSNHKLCQGQISLYFPLLHRDMITRDLEKAYITKEAVADSLNRILEVDYSAFHREVHFRDTAKGIEKELVMKRVIPDIILVPVFGSRAIMWQEIAGRNRSTPGRFNIPIFSDESIDDMLTRLVGNFRWELCRTMMGSAWNDVTEISLTSEYTDYIQFFKRNRELSEEAKDRIKAQVQKYHNRMRDVFTADYELWLNNEARGNLRLNKVARGILFRHCPFSRAIREQLDKQPVFTELSAIFRNQRAKMARDLESRYGKYAKIGPLDPDLEQNLVFYRDM